MHGYLRQTFQSIVVVTAALVGLSACTQARLTSKPESIGTVKMTSARVQWQTFGGVTFQFPKAFGADYSTKELQPFLQAFIKKSPEKIEALLAAGGVPKGNEYTIELTPQVFTMNGTGAKNFSIGVVVRTGTASTRGWMTVAANGTDYVEPDAFVDTFAKTLVEEMKKANWY